LAVACLVAESPRNGNFGSFRGYYLRRGEKRASR
jgi:hypothetical protein